MKPETPVPKSPVSSNRDSRGAISERFSVVPLFLMAMCGRLSSCRSFVKRAGVSLMNDPNSRSFRPTSSFVFRRLIAQEAPDNQTVTFFPSDGEKIRKDFSMDGLWSSFGNGKM